MTSSTRHRTNKKPPPGLPGALLLGALTMLAPACFEATEISSTRALRLWRSDSTWARPAGTRVAGDTGIRSALDLEQAIALGIRANPQLRDLRAQIDVARARIEEEKQLDNPQLRIRDIRLDRAADGETDMELALRLPIPQPWTLRARIQRARLGFEGEQVRARDAERRVRAQIQRLFARLAMYERDRKQAESTIRLCATHQKQVEQRLAAGAATKVDLSIASLRFVESHDALQLVKVRRAETVEQLKKIIGIKPGQQITFLSKDRDLELKDLALNEKALIERSLRRRMDLRSFASRVGVAEANAYIARARRWPWLRYAEVSHGLGDKYTTREFAISFGLTLPLLSWNGGGVAVRDAIVARRKMEERAKVMETAQQVSRAVRRVKETAARLAQMKQVLMPTVVESDQIVADAISQGVVDPLRSSYAQERKVRVQRKYLRALLAHREAQISLEVAVGGQVAPGKNPR